MNNVNQIETFGNGMKVFRVEPGHVACVKDGTILIKGYHTYQVGTCTAFYADGHGKGFGTIRENENVCREGLDSPVWINQRASAIVRGQHPDHGVCALEVEIGDRVWLEGKMYEIASAPNQNLQFVEVEA